MNLIKRFLSSLIPEYKSLQSVVWIKEGTKSEVEDAIPIEFMSEQDWKDLDQNPPTGVAHVQYFFWTFFMVTGNVVMSDIQDWSDFDQTLPKDTEKALIEISTKVMPVLVDALKGVDLGEYSATLDVACVTVQVNGKEHQIDIVFEEGDKPDESDG